MDKKNICNVSFVRKDKEGNNKNEFKLDVDKVDDTLEIKMDVVTENIEYSQNINVGKDVIIKGLRKVEEMIDDHKKAIEIERKYLTAGEQDSLFSDE